jgi:hypothetical protein
VAVVVDEVEVVTEAPQTEQPRAEATAAPPPVDVEQVVRDAEERAERLRAS